MGLGVLEAELRAVVALAHGAELFVGPFQVVLELLGLGLLVGDGVGRRGRHRDDERTRDEHGRERDETEVTDVAEQGE